MAPIPYTVACFPHAERVGGDRLPGCRSRLPVPEDGHVIILWDTATIMPGRRVSPLLFPEPRVPFAPIRRG